MSESNLSADTHKFVVTGAAGFLGSNLVQVMLEAGHEVIGLDNLSMGLRANVEPFLNHDSFEFRQADVTDARCFRELPEDTSCIVHLAAFKIPRYGNAIETLRINAAGTENVLEFARDKQIKCVLASTSDVYGKNPKLPFNEDDDCIIGASSVPRWAYAVSKLYDEHLGFAYAEAYGIPVTLLRFFGSYGRNQPLSWWGGPPPVFIEKVLNDEVIPIHGTGQQTRSFTYVSDTVTGIYAAAIKPEADNQIINIGSTHEISILDLAHLIKRVSDTPGDIKLDFVPYESFTKNKYEDVMRRVPDVSKCKRLLGVESKVGLEEGMKRTIEWQKVARLTRNGNGP